MNPINFIGAGPGDPELLTVKAHRMLQEADLVVWAGSLINPKILQVCKPSAQIVDSSELTLEKIIDSMESGYRQGLAVARLHTGDPSIFGALREQLRLLRERQIPFRIIPGVSSFLAAAAALEIEYTIPDLTQTLILTRVSGRTSVPAGESIYELAKHNSSLCIFLSIQQIEDVVKDLKKVLAEQTKVAVVEKASWQEERIIKGNLEDIVIKVKSAGINKTALIIVGNCLEDGAERSKLYDAKFAHGYRVNDEIR